MNHSLKIILIFSGHLESFFSLFGLEPSFDIAPGESSGPGSVLILKGTSEHFFPPSVHANECLMPVVNYPQGKAIDSISTSKKSKGWV